MAETVSEPPANVAIVRELYDGWNRDEFAPDRLHPDIEWRTSGLFPGFQPVYHGIAGVREFWATMKDAWEHFTIRVERIVVEGETVVVGVHFQAKGRESGVPVELPFAHAWELRDGLVVRYAA